MIDRKQLWSRLGAFILPTIHLKSVEKGGVIYFYGSLICLITSFCNLKQVVVNWIFDTTGHSPFLSCNDPVGGKEAVKFGALAASFPPTKNHKHDEEGEFGSRFY
ncbi:hypothetical protein [Calidifontibacillus erzurumensis]|uniref:Uncharacterized protein n=1 Tax=Calidifontibacillus erzurumensis TaxID=2741433 RepID=A0A8J8GEB6_9BACI|nr:hypothetical protein [Calidifontibacillus erzurumensis]NSL51944.1 hypothetical protein [Calidifontibacillus erzurumensis]